jgi:hypothetical protein
MKRKDLQRAQSRVRLAGILSEVASRPLADQRHMLNAAVQDMHTDELRAWTDYAEDLFEDLSREEDWKMFSLLGSGLTTAYSRLNREE